MNFENLLVELREKGEIDSLGAGKVSMIKEITENVFMGDIPPSYKVYLEIIGSGVINGFEFNGTGVLEKSALVLENQLYHNSSIHLPENYVLLSDIGDDVSWYFDLSSKDKSTGEYKIRGWILGLGKEEQPNWVKEQETYDTFEDFFRAKALGEDRRSRRVYR